MPDTISPNSAKARLIELVAGCPQGDYSADCPLYDKRDLPSSNKLSWIMALPEAVLLNIYSAHCECLKAKVASQYAGNTNKI